MGEWILIDQGFENGAEGTDASASGNWTITQNNGYHEYDNAQAKIGNQSMWLQGVTPNLWSNIRHILSTPMTEDGSELRMWIRKTGTASSQLMEFNSLNVAFMLTLGYNLSVYCDATGNNYEKGDNVIWSGAFDSPNLNKWIQIRIVFNFTNQYYNFYTRETLTEEWIPRKKAEAINYNIPFTDDAIQSSITTLELGQLSDASFWIDDIYYSNGSPPLEGFSISLYEGATIGANGASLQDGSAITITDATGTPLNAFEFTTLDATGLLAYRVDASGYHTTGTFTITAPTGVSISKDGTTWATGVVTGWTAADNTNRPIYIKQTAKQASAVADLEVGTGGVSFTNT